MAATEAHVHRRQYGSSERQGPDDVALVQLPGSPQGTCSRLKRWLYGMRQAAGAWERHFVKNMVEVGMMSGKSSPVVSHDPKTCVRAVVHGDDFTFLGFETEPQQVKRELQRSYQLKVRAILGADEQHAQKVWSGCGLKVRQKDWTRQASWRIQGTTMKMTNV